MRTSRVSQLAFLMGTLCLLGLGPAVAVESRPNVLFIAVDDLRPELGCYGEPHIHSPNIDKLAASGRLFSRAYCQQALCNPSRTSLMTGRRPDSTGVVGNHSHFRTNLPDVVTLPQYFKQHGYHAAAIGKIYHGVFPDGASITKWDTLGDPQSWSVPAIRFGPRYYYTEEGIAAAKADYLRVYNPKNPGPDDWTKKLVFGPATESPDVPDNTLYDGQVADAAVQALQELKRQEKSFFLAVGFFKPHSPYIAPRKYFEFYGDVAQASPTDFPAAAPRFAGHGSAELRRYTDQPKSGQIPTHSQQRVRQAYFACISYIDAQIGRALDELDRLGLGDNTIIVLCGDHGYHLGEQGLWGKTTNFELDTRVPLIVRTPGMQAAGESSASLVELVDLYPTLAELAGLPIADQLEGESFAAILKDPALVTKTAALSQFPRGGGLMGYSMRTATHRLTQWVNAETGQPTATELYDYENGLVETGNIATEATELVQQLSAQLVALFGLGESTPSPASAPNAAPDATPPTPQTIVGVEIVPLTLPALVGTTGNPLLKLKIETSGQLDPIALASLHATLAGSTDRSDVSSVSVYFGGSSTQFSDARRVAMLSDQQLSTDEFTFSCPASACRLSEGANYVWIACQLRGNVDMDHQVGAACLKLSFSNGESVALAGAPSVQRMGVAVRSGGDDGVHTYRIPGLATTNLGTLIGVYDVRRRSGGDLPGDIDVGMSRSTDGGQTWEPMQTIMDMGDDPKWQYDGIGDPAILVDRNTGIIWVAATWSHGNRSWHGSGPGLQPHETGQLMLVRSDDDGLTWSDPINITSQVKKPEWCFILQGPGKGITMRDGTLVFAAQYQDPPDKQRLPHSTIIYSRDHGTTWQVGTAAFDDTTESQVVEVEPGVLMLNCRYNRKAVRVVMTTRDMGQTWQQHATSEKSLIEPGACMASLIDVDRELGKDMGGWLLFSNPDSTRGRHHLTIKASSDRGGTWPEQHRLLLDEGNSAGYSCMTMIDEKTIGILYEGSRAHMTFQRIPLDRLVNPKTQHQENSHAGANDDRRPNILLIVGEDHGCELSCYGDPVITTPNLDRLASQGVLFEHGYVTQSVCSPSRSTIFTGLYPHQNGQLGLATHDYGWFKKWPTTYSSLKQAGYRTGLIGKTHIIPEDAVESFVDFRFQPSSNFAKRNVADYAVKAGEFFQSGKSPFFMTVNYPDAHWPLQGQVDGLPESQVDPNRVQVMPYVGGETPRMREVVRNYYDCMLRLDACVGQLLQQLEDAGKADNTLVVFIGDHGAQMARGKVTVYEGGMRVPYIVRWPGVATPNLRSQALVSTIDLLPTFMDAAQGSRLAELPGQSLRSVLNGEGAATFRQYVACERNCDAAQHTFPQRTIRDARYKLIHSPVRDREDPAARYYRVHGATHWAGCLTDEELAGASPQTQAGYARWLNPPEYQLYDLHDDPHEWTDLSGDLRHADVRQRLQTALEQWQADTSDPLADPEKLRLLLEENDAVVQSGRRSPQDGWQYLNYLAPGEQHLIVPQRAAR